LSTYFHHFPRLSRLTLENAQQRTFWQLFGQLFRELLKVAEKDLMDAVLETGIVTCWEAYTSRRTMERAQAIFG
jgi:hypothetical protein